MTWKVVCKKCLLVTNSKSEISLDWINTETSKHNKTMLVWYAFIKLINSLCNYLPGFMFFRNVFIRVDFPDPDSAR